MFIRNVVQMAVLDIVTWQKCYQMPFELEFVHSLSAVNKVISEGKY